MIRSRRPSEIDGALGPRYPNRVQPEAFQRGDMPALEAAVEACQDLVWVLARRGFITQRDGLTFWVHGLPDHDAAEHAAVHLIADLIGPTQRSKIDGEPALLQAAMQQVRQAFWQRAERAGRITTLKDGSDRALVPADVQDIDALISSGELPSAEPAAPDAQAEAWMQSAKQCCAAQAQGSDTRTQELIERRFRQGQSPAEVAAYFTCGAAAVSAHESRVRRQLSRALARDVPQGPRGPATIDAVLSDAPWSPTPPAITRARLRRDVLRRTFQDEPKPYGARLAWGLGAAAIAAIAWGLMFFGVLPGPADDTYPTPSVEARCDGPCTAGQPMKVWVLAPKDAHRVAVALRSPDAPEQMLITSPSGGSIRLPFGSNVKLAPIAYPAQLSSPLADGAELVAIFSQDELTDAELKGVLSGQASLPGTLIASVQL